MKYLIAGLGNIGPEYANTRHNIGFTILDALTRASNIVLTNGRYGDIAMLSQRGRNFLLLKPSTYMNLSGNAIRYWLQKEKIPPSRMLVVVDDLALPFGQMRIRKQGGDGGHNGLNHIIEILGHADFARLRFGIGNEFSLGNPVNFVLSRWNDEEEKALPELMIKAHEAILNFGIVGVDATMNKLNKKGSGYKPSDLQGQE